MMKTLGIVLIALALVVAVVPALNNCLVEGRVLTTTSGKQIPMRCFYSAQAELAAAGALALVGALITMSRRRETRRFLGIVGVGLGAMVMLLPTYLIGVCTDMTASCNLIMRPAMLAAGTLAIAVSLAVVVSGIERGTCLEEHLAR